MFFFPPLMGLSNKALFFPDPRFTPAQLVWRPTLDGFSIIPVQSPSTPSGKRWSIGSPPFRLSQRAPGPLRHVFTQRRLFFNLNFSFCHLPPKNHWFFQGALFFFPCPPFSFPSPQPSCRGLSGLAPPLCNTCVRQTPFPFPPTRCGSVWTLLQPLVFILFSFPWWGPRNTVGLGWQKVPPSCPTPPSRRAHRSPPPIFLSKSSIVQDQALPQAAVVRGETSPAGLHSLHGAGSLQPPPLLSGLKAGPSP